MDANEFESDNSDSKSLLNIYTYQASLLIIILYIIIQNRAYTITMAVMIVYPKPRKVMIFMIV